MYKKYLAQNNCSIQDSQYIFAVIFLNVFPLKAQIFLATRSLTPAAFPDVQFLESSSHARSKAVFPEVFWRPCPSTRCRIVFSPFRMLGMKTWFLLSFHPRTPRKSPMPREGTAIPVPGNTLQTLTAYAKTNLKCITDLKLKHKIINL